jgi:tellurite resistance protein
VAWADGSIDDKERSVAFAKAAELGLAKEDISRQLFERWLSEPPPPSLLATWKEYIGVLSASLGPEVRRALRQELLDRARAVAEAAGGFLGIARRVSPAEEDVLKELERALPE